MTHQKVKSLSPKTIKLVFQACTTSFNFPHNYCFSKQDQVYSNTRVSTRVNTSQLESTRVNTNQHESKTSLDHKNRINIAKQNPNVTFQWCFLEKYAESCIYQ